MGLVGAVVFVALVAAFVWLPLERARARNAAQLPALHASIALLERQAEEAKRLRSMPAIAQTAAPATNAPTLPGAQVNTLDARTLALAGADVSFGALLEWIAAMQGAQGWRVESARIEALPAPGRVRAELRLSRS